MPNYAAFIGGDGALSASDFPGSWQHGEFQIALTYRFGAREKAAEAFDPSFLPAAADRKVSGTASH